METLLMSKLATQILMCLLLTIGWLNLLDPVLANSPKIDRLSCTYAGKPLYGRVQIVTSFPDIKVSTVSSLEDLKVQVVTASPDRCGKWQFVKTATFHEMSVNGLITATKRNFQIVFRSAKNFNI
jgi:hypothetical protein